MENTIDQKVKTMMDEGSSPMERRKEKIKKIFLPTEGDALKAFLNNLMACAAHFGHPKTHPTAKALAIDKTNGCNIINLKYTTEALGEVLNKVYNAVSDGEKILFVNTTNQVELFKKIALETGQAYITGKRYRPGFLTNSQQSLMQKNNADKFLKQLESDKSYTSKEKKVLLKKAKKTVEYYEGIMNLNELPKVVIVMGDSKEYPILQKEAKRAGVYFVSFNDINMEYFKTNQKITIPVNIQSNETLEFLLRYISQAILEGYENYIQHSRKTTVKTIPNQRIKKQSQKEIEDKMVESILSEATTTV